MSVLLFGDPSPSLRWRAAVELEGIGEDDDEVVRWRAEIDRSDDITALLARLSAAADRPQAAGYLLCQLAYLGYRGPARADAVERIFEFQAPDGSWPVRGEAAPPQSKRRRGQPPELPYAETYRMITTLTTLPLRGIAAAGFATDPRAERAYDWLVDQSLDDGSWTGSHKADLGQDGRSSGEDPPYRKLSPGEGCRSATTGAAACFALHPERRHSEVAKIGVEHLLAQDSRRAASLGWEVSRLVGEERASGLFTFYVAIDSAFLLDIASRCGFTLAHARLGELVADLRRGRGAYGLWQHPSHPQLSRWLTFDIECSLRRLDDGD
jgi:hypothetical protein